MPQWLPLKKDEVLPLFMHRAPQASIWTRACRSWRTLHRLQRTLIIGLASFVVLSLFYLQLFSLSDQVETAYKEGAPNVRSRNKVNI